MDPLKFHIKVQQVYYKMPRNTIGKCWDTLNKFKEWTMTKNIDERSIFYCADYSDIGPHSCIWIPKGLGAKVKEQFLIKVWYKKVGLDFKTDYEDIFK